MKRAILLLSIILALLTVSIATAQTGGHDLSWNTVDTGGGSSNGGSYTLDGTIGQADVGVASGGGYTLSGGFWGGGPLVAVTYPVYLPLILR